MNYAITDVEPRMLPVVQAIALSIAMSPMPERLDHRLVEPGRSLADTLDAEGVGRSGWLVCVGGVPVPASQWHLVRVKPGQLVEARPVVGKKVLAIGALLALSYLTFGVGLGAAAAFDLGIAGAFGSVGIAAVQGAIMMGGSMLINKLLGPKPAASAVSAAAATETSYSVSAGSNSPRLYAPLGLLLGEVKYSPDLAAQQYTWFEGEDQFLACQLHAGINGALVDQIKVGDTLLSQYQDVRLTLAGFPSGNTGAMPSTSVDAVSGALLDNAKTDGSAGDFTTRTTSVNTVRIAVDLEFTLSKLSNEGAYQSATVELEIAYRKVGTTDWMAFFGDGLRNVFANASGKPLRRTLTRDVPAGRYEIQLRKITANATSTQQQNAVTWTQLKSYQADTADYAQQPRVLIEVKASGQLNGALNNVNWIGRARPLDLWNGQAWVTVTEPGSAGISNPGALLLQLYRGIRRESDGRLIAGYGLPDSRIDIESLKAFMVRCIAKDFRFDLFLQQQMSLQDLTNAIADVGLGRSSRRTGRYGVVWLAEDQPINGIINMARMKARSFSVDYDLSPTADELEYQFNDAEADWVQNPVRVVDPTTVGTPQRTASMATVGVTRGAQAAVRARFTLGQSLYARKSISFELDLEHLNYPSGTVVALSHDLTQWGFSGRLAGFSRAVDSFTLQLDEPLPDAATGIRMMGLQLPGVGGMRVYNVANVSADRRTVRIDQAWPDGLQVPGVGRPAHDTVWIFDFKAVPGLRARVVSVSPLANMKGARMTVVPESPEFWDYVWNGTWTQPGNDSLLPMVPPSAGNASITAEQVRVGEAWRTQLTVSFDAAGNYDHAQVWGGADGSTPVLLGETPGVRVSWYADTGRQWSVEVRPFDALGRLGGRAYASYTLALNPPANVAGLAIDMTASGAVVSWAAPTGVSAVDWSVTEIRQGANYGTAAVVYTGRGTSLALGWLPAGVTTVWARHKNTSGEWSDLVSTALTVLAPAQPIVVGKPDRSVVLLEWLDCRATQPIASYRLSVGATLATSVPFGAVNATTYSRIETSAGRRRYWVVAVDVAGNTGAAGYVEVTIFGTIDEGLHELEQGLDDTTALLLAAGKRSEYSASVKVATEAVQRVEDVATEAAQRAADIANEAQTRLLADVAEATDRALGDAATASAAALDLSHEASLRAQADQAEAETRAQGLLAEALARGTGEAHLTQLIQEGDFQLAADMDLLAAVVNNDRATSVAAFQQERLTSASETAAVASDVVSLAASFGPDKTNLVSNPVPVVNTAGWAGSVGRVGRHDAGVPAGAPTSFVFTTTARDNDFSVFHQVVPKQRHYVEVICAAAAEATAALAVGLHILLEDGSQTWIPGATRAVSGVWSLIGDYVTIPDGAVSAALWVQLSHFDDSSRWFFTAAAWRPAGFVLPALAYIDQKAAVLAQVDLAQAEITNAIGTRLTAAESGLTGHSTAIQSLETVTAAQGGTLTTHSTQLDSLTSRISGAESGLSGQSAAIGVLQTSVTSQGGELTTHAQQLVSLTSRIDGAEGGLGAQSTAIGFLQTTTTQQGGTLTTHGERLDNLSSRIGGAEGTIGGQSTAIGLLQTAVTQQGGTLTTYVQQLDSLTSRITGAEGGVGANSSAIGILETTASQQGSTLSTHSQQLASLDSRIGGAEGGLGGQAQAIGQLQTTVTQQGDAISAHSGQLVNLNSRVGSTETGVGSNSTAIAGLQTTASQQGGTLTTHAEQLASLSSRIGGAEGGVGANSTAITGLQTTASQQGGTLTAHAEQLASLGSRIGGAEGGIGANSTAIAGLQTTATQQGGTLSTHSEQITGLNGRITGAEGSIGGQATAISGLQTTVTQQGSAIEAQALSVQQLSSTVGSNNATLTTSFQTLANEQGAQASLLSSLQLTVGGQAVSISQAFSAVAGVDGRVSAITTLRTEVGGYVSGTVSENNGTTSTLVFLYDKIAFAKQIGDTLIYPFIVGTVAGATTAGINGNLIVDDTIQARALLVDTLDAISAKLGYITSGRFDLVDDGSGGWGFFRSYPKWLNDGTNGFVFARHASGQSFMEIKAGASRLAMDSSGNYFEMSGPWGNLTNAGLYISQIDVIDTINVKDSAITFNAFAGSNGFDRYFTPGTAGGFSGRDTFSSLGFNTRAGDIVEVTAYFRFQSVAIDGGTLGSIYLTPRVSVTGTGSGVATLGRALWSTYNSTEHLGLEVKLAVVCSAGYCQADLQVDFDCPDGYATAQYSRYSISSCLLSAFIRRK